MDQQPKRSDRKPLSLGRHHVGSTGHIYDRTCDDHDCTLPHVNILTDDDLAVRDNQHYDAGYNSRLHDDAERKYHADNTGYRAVEAYVARNWERSRALDGARGVTPAGQRLVRDAAGSPVSPRQWRRWERELHPRGPTWAFWYGVGEKIALPVMLAVSLIIWTAAVGTIWKLLT